MQNEQRLVFKMNLDFFMKKALLFVIDGSSDDDDGRSPVKDYEVLMNELRHY